MSWRTVVISTRCKLDYKMGYMVIRSEEIKRIFLDEIAIVIIENPAVAITGCLLEVLTEKKIKIIFCNKERNPYGEIAPYYGSFDCSRKLKTQIEWSEAAKGTVWTAIIAEKISKQAQHLGDAGRQKEALMLESYVAEMEYNDSSNREGHAAKVYFNALFGMDFTRDDDSNPINAALNYGYAIMLSAFNRAVVTNGYVTQLGIHHGNVFNHFNLSSDIMEPFRILIDRAVAGKTITVLSKELKYELADVLNKSITIASSKQTVLNAIDIYTKSVFKALNSGEADYIRFYSL